MSEIGLFFAGEDEEGTIIRLKENTNSLKFKMRKKIEICPIQSM